MDISTLARNTERVVEIIADAAEKIYALDDAEDQKAVSLLTAYLMTQMCEDLGMTENEVVDSMLRIDAFTKALSASQNFTEGERH